MLSHLYNPSVIYSTGAIITLNIGLGFYWPSLNIKHMNKKISTAIVSTIIGTLALTQFVSAEESNTSLKNGFGFFNKFFHQNENAQKDTHKNESRDDNRKNATSSPRNNTDTRMALLKARGVKEIDSRITALNKLSAKIQGLINITPTNKTALLSGIQTQVNSLTALKNKINADTDVAILKTDVESITKSFRTFALEIPKANILAKIDSHFVDLTMLTSITAALSTDIQTAKTSGKDVAVLLTKLSETDAKIADANLQSNAAIALVTPLIPDVGSSTLLLANKQALLDSYAKYKIAIEDIRIAKKDIKDIVKQLREWNTVVTAKTNTDSR